MNGKNGDGYTALMMATEGQGQFKEVVSFFCPPDTSNKAVAL